MAGTWGTSGTNYLTYTPGTFVGTGAFSMAVLCQPSAANSNLMRLMTWLVSTTEKGQLLLDTGPALYGHNDFTAGITPQSSTGWNLYAITKAAGTAVYRMHDWPYAAAGTGTMAHTSEATTYPNETGVVSACRVGFAAGAPAVGDIAVSAYWGRALSDAELDSLKSPNLSTWAALSPDLGIHLGSWSGTAGDVVFAGTSGNATLTGTITTGANPSGFNFTLSSRTKAKVYNRAALLRASTI